MQFIFSDTEGHEALHTDTSFLLEVLSRPYTDWQSGTGDSAIQVKDDERLIFFKTEKGVFIMQHPDYLAPLIHSTNSNSKPITHYVGGEPMNIPTACISDEQTAFEILRNYIESGALPDKSYPWVDFTELIQD